MENLHIRDCEGFEALLADWLDGTLGPAQVAAMEAHLSGCAGCTAYVADVKAAMGYLAAADEVEPPVALVNRILFQIPQKESGIRAWLGRFFEPVMQPRIVMGAMMTVLSLAMMTRCTGTPNRPLTASDLDPVKMWGSFDDRVHRTWDRTVKAYEDMRVVYELRTQVKQWQQQEEAQDSAAADQQMKARQLPARSAEKASAAAAKTGAEAQPSPGEQKK